MLRCVHVMVVFSPCVHHKLSWTSLQSEVQVRLYSEVTSLSPYSTKPRKLPVGHHAEILTVVDQIVFTYQFIVPAEGLTASGPTRVKGNYMYDS